MTMRGTFREIIPVGKQQMLAARAPGAHGEVGESADARSAVALPDGGGMIAAEIPGVELHEVVAVELE